MKKNNLRKYLILTILVLIIIVEIITWGNSKAENVIQIQASVSDNNNLLQTQTATLSATDGGASGYYINLPRVLNTKIISKYYIEERTIDPQTQEEIITYVEKNYGDVIYLTSDQTTNLSMSFKVAYDTKVVNTTTLYKKVLEHSIDESNSIKLEGYMPEAAIANVSAINNIVADEIINAYPGILKSAYDLKITNNGTPYLCADYSETIKIIYNNIANDVTYQLISLDDSSNAQSTREDLTSACTINVPELSVNVSILKSYFLIDKTPGQSTAVETLPATDVINITNVLQAGGKWDGTTSPAFAYGTGTSIDPYLIATGSDLAYLASQVNAGQTYEGVYFNLVNDIDLDNRAWSPIGNYDNSFRGVFDGAGHSIKNCTITTSSTFPTDTMYTYGIFGSIGGGTGTRTEVKNTQFDNIDISITSTGTMTGTVQRGYSIGFVTGTMFKNSTVSNVVVKGSTVNANNNISIRSNYQRVLVGGIAGETLGDATMSTAPSDPGSSLWYSIDNCYVKADFTLARITTSSRTYAAQYSIGGIIGRIRTQGVWPTNCLYEGNINAYGFIGPLFGTLLTSSSYGTAQYDGMWNGNNYGNLTSNSYYTNYNANSRNFTSSVTSGTAGYNTNYRYSSNSTNIGYVQGVNKGTYISDTGSLLAGFNTRAGGTVLWNYENGEFSLVPRITAAIDEPTNFNYKIYIADSYDTGTYTYKWYIDGVFNSSITGSTAAIYNTSLTTDKNVVVLISDGTYNTIVKFTVPKITINIAFNIDRTNNIATASFTGTGARYAVDSDYTFEWYKEDITGLDSGKIDGATTKVLTGISPDYDYRLVATNNKNSQLSTEGRFSYYDRTVIYVDYTWGYDTNDGLSEDTPVKTMKKAYEKLDINGNVHSNIIVVMRDYMTNDYLYTTSSTYATVQANFSKKATVTGLYKSTNYNTAWYLGIADVNNTGNLLFDDTRFMYLKMYGSTSSTGQGASYIYTQGHNLTMGEGIVMQRYAVSSTGYALASGNAPDFHLVCGFLNYNWSSIPEANNNGTVTINSGTYSRILSGSRNSVLNSTSHNITGSLANPYKIKLVIDIKNSTTNTASYPNDINSIFGGQTDGNIYNDYELTVNNGEIGRVVGGSIGYNRTITGYPCNSYFGKSKLNVNGGTINELYGGSLGRNKSDVYYYGEIEININGGTIYSNIYGAGAGGVTGYDATSTDPYKSYGQSIATKSTVNVNGGTINGNIYGAGYGYSPYLDSTSIATDGGALYGNSFVNINGGTVTGNIYGAGRGYSGYSGKTTLARMKGNTSINIKNTPVISGSIYGAGEGVSGYAETAKLTGNSNIINESNFSNNIYAGGNISSSVGDTNIDINNGNLTGEIYGGGNLGSVTGNTNINLNAGTINAVYGGGKSAGITNSNIALKGSTVTTIYGGSNVTGNVTSSNLLLTSGTVSTVYGGNNLGGTTTTTNINLNGATITSDLYGGGNQANCSTSNLNLENSPNLVPNVYGGGNRAGVTNTILNCKGVNITKLFGGSNTTGNVLNSLLNIYNGTIGDIYGGNNLGGTTTNTNINVIGGNITNIYGGGEQVASTTSNIKVASGNITNIYGGGNQAGINTSNLDIIGGQVGSLFGGANVSGDVNQTNVKTKDTVKINTTSASTTDDGLIINTTCSAASTTWQSSTYPTIATINVTISNLTASNIDTWNGKIIAKDSVMYNNYSSTNITENNGEFSFNQVNKYYGINSIPSNGNYSFSFEVLSMQSVESFNVDKFINDFMVINNKQLNIQNVYGGNNLGGTTGNSLVDLKYGTVNTVYGGGNQAITTTTNLNVSNNITGCVYGGGNQANVNVTNLNLTNASVLDNVYGGGNEGSVTTNTNVHVKNSTLSNSLYAGGNGTYATVHGNTNLIMDGTSNSVTNNVFGGGNKAETGEDALRNSICTVNIAGATIGKNVYGGANTSVVYGTTQTNIGYDAVNNNTLEKGNVKITGTVFGGGEANEAGSEIYDFSFISVTNGINININGNSHTEFYIRGSIFGSGNASSTSGTSHINIKNYGNIDLPQKNVSIQRATEVVLDNSAIVLSGAKDRTNEYSNVNFSISRVKALKLKNNSTLYLNCGVNLLENLHSLVDIGETETLGAATINPDTGDTVKNVDNRVYMYEGKVLNIATNEQVTAYGKVYGMTFLGMYTNTTNPSTSTGLYNHTFENGEEITNMGTFSSNSYVLAEHKANHDTSIDGFYTNINNEGYAKTKYIDVAPQDDLYYIWSVGEALDVTNFDLTLTASKYATLGTYELSLTGFSNPNTKFLISGFSSGLNDNISLVDKSQIDAIDETNQLADKEFGLSMKSGKNGWSTNSETNFYADGGATYSGSGQYLSDNSTHTPTLSFCFYHAQNLTLEQALGNVKIRLQVLTPIDDLTYGISYIDININLLTALFQDDYYEAAITPGEEFGLFNTTETSITNKSKFSTYYSLFIPDFSTSKYFSNFANDERVIVSRTSDNQNLVYKENTKITMIDLVTNMTYYYNVTAQDEQSGKNSYKISEFKKMGSTNEYYDKTYANSMYYDTAQNIEYESFVFQVDFSQSNQNTEISNSTLFIELQDQGNQTLIGVLGIQRDSCKYSVYPNKDSVIDVNATLSTNTVYLGQIFNLDVATDYKQQVINSKIVYDTKYFQQQMGIKITCFDSNLNQLNADSLLGVKFILDGKTYYPRIDGTVRINIAERVSNVISKIKFDTTKNTTLATGKYTIKVESFGSPDGVYYGLTSSDFVTKDINIINGAYGLKVWFDDKTKIVDKETGNTLYGNNTLLTNINYSSAIANPTITVSLERRDYSAIYSLNYNKLDLKEYMTNTLTEFKTNEYIVSTSPQASSTFFLNVKPQIKTGTYKVLYKVYDGTTYIGEASEYFIVK